MTINDLTTLLYKLLIDGCVKPSISGDVYKYVRPNSDKEDVVVTPISLVGQGYQRGTVNLNIWVPDIQVSGQSTPDSKRLDAISKTINDLIKGSNYGDLTITINGQTLQEEADLKYHFCSIAVDFEIFIP